jgi:cell division protein FtsB
VRTIGRALAPALVVAVALSVLVVGVFPTRTLWAQRSATAAAEDELATLRRENRALEERMRRLGDPEEIERLAREEYGLVRPGEEPYVVIPLPAPVRPRTPADDDRNLVEKAWDAVRGLF